MRASFSILSNNLRTFPHHAKLKKPLYFSYVTVIPAHLTTIQIPPKLWFDTFFVKTIQVLLFSIKFVFIFK